MAAETATGFSSGIGLAVPDASNAAAETPQRQTRGGAGPWWQVAQDSGLRIRNVGAYEDAPGERPAVAALFSDAFATDGSFNRHLAVYDPETRQRIAGTWRVGSDSHLLYFVLPKPGRYVVRIRAGLTDRGGHTLNHSVSGPVHIP